MSAIVRPTYLPRSLFARIAAPLCHASPEEYAEDYSWFRERLADPALLDCAVGVQVDSAVLLAVPAAGSRRGGCVSVGSVTDAVRVWAALRGRPGFPGVRLGQSVHSSACHKVCWGARQRGGDAERGKYFGYTQAAINTFLRHVALPGVYASERTDHDQ